MRLLIIEDNEIDYKLVIARLETVQNFNYEIHRADCLQSGLTSLQTMSVDILLMDLGLPDSRGIQGVELIQNQFPALPIVILSMLDDEAIALNAIRLGAQDYLMKNQITGPMLSRTLRYAYERKRIEEELKHTRAQLEATLNALPDLLIEFNADRQLLSFHSPDPSAMWANSVAHLDHQLMQEILSIEMAKLIEQATPDLAKQGYSFGHGCKIDVNGEHYWFEVSLSSKRSSGYKDYGILCLCRDISKRQRAEQQAQKKQTILQALLDNSPASITLKDLEGRYIMVNRAFARSLQLPEQDILGKTVEDIFPQHTAAEYRRDDQQAILCGEPLYLQRMVPNLEGEARDYLTVKFPLRDEDGHLVATGSISTDITTQNRTALALQESNSLNQAILQAAPPAIAYVTNQGVVRFWNRAAEQMFEWRRSQEAADDSPPREFGVDTGNLQALAERVIGGDSLVDFEISRQKLDGNTIDLSISTAPVRDAQEQIIGVVAIASDVSDRKKAEAERQRHEQWFRLFFDLPFMGMVIISPSQRFLEFNDQFCIIVGYPREELTQYTWSDLCHPKFRKSSLVVFGQLLRKKREGYTLEQRLIGKAGNTVYVAVKARAFYKADGELDVIVATVNDITQRKQAERTLKLLSQAVEQNPTSIVVTDVRGRIEYVNPKFCSITGYSKEEALGQNPRILKSGYQKPEYYENLWNTITAGREWRGEFQNSKKNGELYWEYASISPIIDKAGKIANFVAVKEDITEKKWHEEQLLLEEDRLNSLLRLSNKSYELTESEIIQWVLSEVMSLTNSQTAHLLFFDQAEKAPRLFCRSLEGENIDHKNNNVLEAIDIWKKCAEIKQPIVTHRESNSIDKRDHSDDKDELVQVACVPILDGDEIAVVIMSDISGKNYDDADIRQISLLGDALWQIIRRKRAEELQREVQQAQQALFKFSNDAVFVINADTWSVTETNPAACRLVGRTPVELQGQQFLDLFPSDRAALAKRTFTPSSGPAGKTTTLEISHADGKRITVEAMPSQVLTLAGRHIMFGTFRDISERVRTEEHFRQYQKLEAMGQLTGGLAHDFNNLLGIIIGNLDLLNMRLEGDSRSEQKLQVALSAAMRGVQITKSLLAVARRQSLTPQAVNVNNLIKEMLPLIRHTVGPAISVVDSLCQQAAIALVDINGFQNALLNLVINARDAMQKGGELRLETLPRVIAAGDSALFQGLLTGEYIVINIADTGAGMSEEVIARVFEPFFTTKERGRGTGLGLAMVYGFIKQSGGHVSLHSEPGQGTTVSLYLSRRAAEEPRSTRPAFGASKLPRGKELVLVVDDEKELIELITNWLEELGYRVQSALNGDAALKILEAAPNIDLLLSDVVMPGGIDGIELVEKARMARPMLRALLTSGFAERVVGSTGNLPAPLLQKPYRKTQLAQAVRVALDGVEK